MKTKSSFLTLIQPSMFGGRKMQSMTKKPHHPHSPSMEVETCFGAVYLHRKTPLHCTVIGSVFSGSPESLWRPAQFTCGFINGVWLPVQHWKCVAQGDRRRIVFGKFKWQMVTLDKRSLKRLSDHKWKQRILLIDILPASKYINGSPR